MKKLLIPLLGGLLFLTACNNSTDDKKDQHERTRH